MKIIAKIRDLFLHPSWIGFFLLLFLYGFVPYFFKEMGYTWNKDLFFYSSLIIITILSFAAYPLIGIEYVDKVKIYSPKKRKLRFAEVLLYLSAMTIFILLYLDKDSSNMGKALVFTFSIFFISSFYLLYTSKESKKENKLVKLILTKSKIIIYRGFRRIKKMEYDLNNLMASLDPENQLKLIATGEQQESTSIDLNELKEKDRIELLEILLK